MKKARSILTPIFLSFCMACQCQMGADFAALDGQAVMSWVGTPGRFRGEYPIQFFCSTDGGKSWEEEVQTLAGNHDGTKITALGQEFYFTTVRFREDMGADVYLYHKEGNSPFGEVAKIDGKGQRLNFCEPAILTDGTIVVPASHFLRKIWVQLFEPATRELSYPNTPGNADVADKFPGGGHYLGLAARADGSFQLIWSDSRSGIFELQTCRVALK